MGIPSDVIDQNDTAASGIKASEAHPFHSLLSTAKPDTSTLFQSGPVVSELSRPSSPIPSSFSGEKPLSVVASKLLTQDNSNKEVPGEFHGASFVKNDEALLPESFRVQPAEIVNQVHPKIEPEVVSNVPQHHSCTIFDGTCQESLSPVSDSSLNTGLTLVSPIPISSPSSTLNVKYHMKEVEALRAQVKELQSKRDKAQRRSEEEQKKTEKLAVSCETKFSKTIRQLINMTESA